MSKISFSADSDSIGLEVGEVLVRRFNADPRTILAIFLKFSTKRPHSYRSGGYRSILEFSVKTHWYPEIRQALDFRLKLE